MLTLTKIIVSTLVTFLFVSCVNINNGVSGKGNFTTKEVNLDKEFEKVSIAKGWDAELILSDENKIVIKANENLVEIFTYEINGRSLSISAKKNINSASSKSVKIYYSNPITHYKTSSGSTLLAKEKIEQENVMIETSSGSELKLDLKTKNAKIQSSSGSELELKGTSINLTAAASSGSEIEAKDLAVKNAELKASSGGSIKVEVKEFIEAETSSGGSIDYYGNPTKKKVKQSISGDEISAH